jgi:hypothetical protein
MNIEPGATYLSGKGADKYQDPDKFTNLGLGFTYSEFVHPQYEQSTSNFLPGLSVVDLILNVGWVTAGRLLN